MQYLAHAINVNKNDKSVFPWIGLILFQFYSALKWKLEEEELVNHLMYIRERESVIIRAT